jgi:LysM repeat protein
MEGGYLPWKLQEIKDKPIPIEEIIKPLPPPPNGYYWVRHEDGKWKLHKHSSIIELNDQTMVTFENPSILEHVVMEDDTFPGLCLQYHISAVQLRRANCFSGNSIKGFQTLRIPVSPNQPIEIQLSSQDVLIQKFRNVSGEGKIEARIYLEESDWDLEKALTAWRGDESWNKLNHIPSTNFSGMDEDAYSAIVVRAEAQVVRPVAVASYPTIVPLPVEVTPNSYVAPHKVRFWNRLPWRRRPHDGRSMPIATSATSIQSVPATIYGDPAAQSLL